VTDVAPRMVLLTGATGFLGPYVTAALAAAGWRVRLAVRRALPQPSDVDVAMVGAITGATDWQAALTGIDAVVHLAGLAHRGVAAQEAERDLYFETNTRATLHLAEAAAAAGVRHFVFASSIAINGAVAEESRPFRESDPPAPQTVYGSTKAAAEAGLAAIAGRCGMTVDAIRPPMIYGRHARGSFHSLSLAIGLHLPLPLGAVRNRRAFVAAENVASFIAFRLAQPTPGFAAFIVADDEQVSTADFCRRMGRAMHTRVLLLPVPLPALSWGLRAAGAGGLVDSVLGSLVVDTAKARSTGWRPDFSLDDGLRRALDV
jgi:UDP-glucose 4-epimerase